MPANLDISSSIIQAFQQGRQLAMQKKQQIDAEQQQRVENDLRQKTFDEQVRQHKEQLAQEADFEKHRNSIADAIFKANQFKTQVERQDALKEQFLKGMPLPPGYQETNPGEFSPAPVPKGVDPAEYAANYPVVNTGGETPQSFAQKQAQLETTKLGPAAANAQAIKNLEIVAAQKEKQDALTNALTIARERDKTTLAAAALRSKANSGTFSDLANMAIKNPEILNDPKVLSPKARDGVLQELASKGVNIATAGQEATLSAVNSALDSLNEIKNDPNFETGAKAAMLSKVPGTTSYANALALNQLKSLLTLPELKNMRGLGSMSDNDLKVLASSATKLDIGSPTFKKELAIIEEKLNKGKAGIESQTQGSRPSLEDLYNGTK